MEELRFVHESSPEIKGQPLDSNEILSFLIGQEDKNSAQKSLCRIQLLKGECCQEVECCGPENCGLIDAMIDEARYQHWRKPNIH